MYTPNAMVSATAAVTKPFAIWRKENVKFWRDSIRPQRAGIKFALASGVEQASRYARNRASNLSSSLPRIEFIIIPRTACRRSAGILPLFRGAKGLQHPLAGPEQPDLKGIFVDLINLLKLLQRKPFHFFQHQQNPIRLDRKSTRRGHGLAERFLVPVVLLRIPTD